MPGPNRDLDKYRRAMFAQDAFVSELGGSQNLYSMGRDVGNRALRDVGQQVTMGFPRQDPEGFYIRELIRQLRNGK